MGSSERTIHAALKELVAAGLVSAVACQGQGTGWCLLPVPENLPAAAEQYFSDKLLRQRKGLDLRKTKLTETGQLLKDALQGADRAQFRSFVAQSAADTTSVSDLTEE